MVQIGIRGQEALGHGPDHAGTCSNVGQHAKIADVATLDPICAHQGGHDQGLTPFKSSPMDQAVGIQRIGDALGRVGVHLHAVLFGNLAKAVVDRLKLRIRSKAGEKVAALVHAFGWHVGVQLERVPGHEKGMVGMLFQGTVKIGLAKIAPGADRVREYVKCYHVLAYAVNVSSLGRSHNQISAPPARTRKGSIAMLTAVQPA